jgi:hypothetical protein
MESADSLEHRVRGLFRHVHLTNCQLDGFTVSEAEEKRRTEVPIWEVVDALGLQIEGLLVWKRDTRTCEAEELRMRCQQFEGMLQHLEGEVRKHIRVSGK